MIPYTTIPLISAFFLVFVGVLIGHFIWYRYRDEQEHRANGMRRKIDDLHASLDLQTGEFTQANSRIADIELELESERAENNRLAARLEDHEALYESAAADLGKAEQINVELRDELNSEAQKRIEFQRQVDELQNALSSLEEDRSTTSDRVTELATDANRSAQLVEQLQADKESLQVENRSLQQQLGDHATTIDQLKARQHESLLQIDENSGLQDECKRVSALLRQAEAESQSGRERFEAERQRFVTESETLWKDNEELQKANSEYANQLESQMTLTNDLSGKVSAALTDLNRLEKKAADARAVIEDRDRLIDELDTRQLEIQRLTDDLNSACAADEEARQELKRVRVEREELDQGLKGILARQEEADLKLQEHDRRRQKLERALAAASEDVAQLLVERERLEGVEDEVVELDAKLRQASTDLKVARTEREEALAAESSTREIVVELRDELQDRLESVQALEQQKESALSTLESEIINRQRINAEVERKNADVERLSSEVETLKRRDSEQSERLAKVSEDFGQLRARYEQAAAQVKLYQQRVSDFEAAQTASRENRKRPSLLGHTTSAKTAFSFRQVQRKEDVVRADDKTKVRHDDRLGTLFAEAPFRSDDLTYIHGISDAIRQELNALGVFTYKQVMEWDNAVIEEFTRRIGCDRIVEQDWVGQARRLYHQHYRAAA